MKLLAMAISNNDDAHEIPSPPSGEMVRVRGRRGKHRTRTAAARGLARQLRKKSTDAEQRLSRLLRDRRFAEFKFRRQYPCPDGGEGVRADRTMNLLAPLGGEDQGEGVAR